MERTVRWNRKGKLALEEYREWVNQKRKKACYCSVVFLLILLSRVNLGHRQQIEFTGSMQARL